MVNITTTLKKVLRKILELTATSSAHVFENRFETGIVCRIGSVKMLYLNDSTVAFKAETRYELGTLAEEYRPMTRIEKLLVISADDTNTYTARLIIGTDGIVYFTPMVDRGVGTAIKITETYI